jgi:hypothetical protein
MAKPLHHVGPIDARGLDLDQHLAFDWLRHRPLDGAKNFRAAGRFGIDRNHS